MLDPDEGQVLPQLYSTCLSKFSVEYLDPDLPTLIVGDFNENRSGDAVAHLLQKGYQSALPEFSPYQTTFRWWEFSSWREPDSYLPLAGRTRR